MRRATSVASASPEAAGQSARLSSRREIRVPVFRPNDADDAEPLCTASLEERDAWVAAGIAVQFGRRGSKLRLRSLDPQARLRGQSAGMGPNVIFRAAAGDSNARTAAEAWPHAKNAH